MATLFAGRLVVNIAQRFVYPFLPAIARGLGISIEAAGLLVSARWASGLATPGIISAAGRGERPRRLATIGLILFAIGAAVTAWLGVFAGAIAGFVLMGAGKPTFDIASQSYVAERTPFGRRARYLSALELTWALGLLIGAPAAGWLIDRFAWETPFIVLAVAAILSLLALPIGLEPDRPAVDSPGLRGSWSRRGTALLMVAVLFSLAAEVMFVVFGAWLEISYGLSLVALGGAGFLVGLAELSGEGSTLLFGDRFGLERATAVGLVLSAIGFGAIGFTPDTLLVGMAFVVIAFFGFEVTIVSAIPLATEVAPQARARFLSMWLVAIVSGRAAGAALGGIVFETFGVAGNAALAVSADILALAILLAGVMPRDA